MNKQRLILLLSTLALATTAPFSNAQAQQLSESRLAQLLKRFPAADANGDGKLTAEEFKAARQQFQRSRQGNARPAAVAQTKLVFDPGWEKEKFPPHAVSLKTPEEIMAIYKRGAAGRTSAASDALSFPKPADGIMRIVGTGHSFMAPAYKTLPVICRAVGFEQPLCLHTGGGITGSARYKWEQENGIFEFDGKPRPKWPILSFQRERSFPPITVYRPSTPGSSPRMNRLAASVIAAWVGRMYTSSVDSRRAFTRPAKPAFAWALS